MEPFVSPRSFAILIVAGGPAGKDPYYATPVARVQPDPCDGCIDSGPPCGE
jgi:hypothetical protein